MHLNFAQPLSEGKSILRFNKNEVLRDVLYYSPTEKLLPFNEPLCCVSWQLVCPRNPYGTPPEAINASGGNVFFN